MTDKLVRSEDVERAVRGFFAGYQWDTDHTSAVLRGAHDGILNAIRALPPAPAGEGEGERLMEILDLAYEALDNLMGDSDLPEDDSLEMRAMQAISELHREREGRNYPCPECGGAGWVAATRPTCCGNLSPSGGCWGGCAVEEQYRAQCDSCGGSGSDHRAALSQTGGKD